MPAARPCSIARRRRSRALKKSVARKSRRAGAALSRRSRPSHSTLVGGARKRRPSPHFRKSAARGSPFQTPQRLQDAAKSGSRSDLEESHAHNRTFYRRPRGQGHIGPVRRRVRADDRRRPGQGGAGLQGRAARRGRERQGRAGRVGRHQSAAPRPRDDEIPRTGAARLRQARRSAGARARQDRSRRQGRHPARPRGGRIRLRHSASDEGRIHRRRRPRHRHLFDAPAARRRRRHHAVQFPGDDPDVEIRARDRLRQCLHPQAVGARSRRADDAGRT